MKFKTDAIHISKSHNSIIECEWDKFILPFLQDWVNIQTEAYKTDEWWVGLRYITDWKWMQYGGDNTLM